MTDDRSMKRIVTLGAPSSGRATDPKAKPARLALDFASWRAHIAAPGSRFEPAEPVLPRIVRLDAFSRAAGSSEGVWRMA